MVVIVVIFLIILAGGALMLIQDLILDLKMDRLPAPYQKIKMSDGQILEGPMRTLGQGAFGTVCLYKLGNQSVAVKIPKSIEYNALQEREILFLKKVNQHPNIIKFIDQVVVSRKLWAITELMQGSLRDLMNENGNLSSKTKLSIARQLACGVAFLHNFNSGLFNQRAIVHQDLKPDNLLVDSLVDDPNISVKISDFGISRQLDQVKLPLLGKMSSKLHEGRAGGTLLYTAPEIITAMINETECCEPKSDVFSIGLILWELATGCAPTRSMEELEQGTFQAFNADKAAGRERVTKSSFFWSTKETWSDPTYPRSSFFGPVIDKCIKSKAEERLSARRTLEELQQISIR